MNLYHFVSVLPFFCNKTKWFSCLHLVVLLPFVFFVLIVFDFFIPLKGRPPKTGHNKNLKKQTCRKKTDKNKFQLAQLCSQTGVLLLFGVGLKMSHFSWKHNKTCGFSIFCKWPKHVKKVESKLGSRLSRKYVAQHNWTKFRLKK